MLFIQSNSLALSPGEGERLRLLAALTGKGLKPLIRSAREHAFGALAGGAVEAAELEHACAEHAAASGKGAYPPGDLFNGGACLLALVFGAAGETPASVVYALPPAEPLPRLGRFCRDVHEALASAHGGADSSAPSDSQA